MRVLFAVLAATGCGRIGFTPSEDASVASDTVQMPDTPPACANYGPWQTPTKVAELDTPGNTEWAATLTADQLTVLFASNVGATGSYDIFMATRASVADPFGAPVEQVALSTPDAETDPAVTPDGLTLYYTTLNLPPAPALMRATRPDAQSSFGSPQVVPESASQRAFGPGLAKDGGELFFQGDTSRIFRAVITAGPVLTLTGELLELGTNVGFPTLSPDGLTMYMEKVIAVGDDDIYVATRPAIGQPFSAPSVVSELRTSLAEGDPDLSYDGLTMYFSSDRDGVSEDIYVTTRSCL